jgi:hypothetical protein
MFPCELHCVPWIKPSPMSAPGVPTYLVDNINASIASLLLAVLLVMAIKSARSSHRRLNGQQKYTD